MTSETKLTPCPQLFSGFSSWQELGRLVWECDCETPEGLSRFAIWKESDRTKAGLLRLGKRLEYRPETEYIGQSNTQISQSKGKKFASGNIQLLNA
ncbi:MAG: hypothetical protein HQM09_14055 [Candidatus Riflebacteria bacterium]|nr:hypothetical protein [Candidatus Riflebacteria bacterium]